MLLLFLLLGVGVAAVAASTPKNGVKKPAKKSCVLTPRPKGAAYSPFVDQGTTLPETSPNGHPWVMWKASTRLTYDTRYGLDSSGVFWAYGRVPFTCRDPFYTPGKKCIGGAKDGFFMILPKDLSGGDLISSLGEAVTTYVLPALAIAASAVIPGIGGIVASAILVAASRMARGASVTSALIDSTRDALPALRDNRAFDAAYTQADSLYQSGKTIAAVGGASTLAKAKLSTPEQRTAYDQGVIMATAKDSQGKAIAWLKEATHNGGVIDVAMSHGAALIDVADVLGGECAVDIVTSILAGQAPPPLAKSSIAAGPFLRFDRS